MLSSAVSSVFPPPLHAASSLASSRSGFCAPSKSGRNGCRNSRSRRSSSGVPLIIRSCTLPGGSSPPPAPAASMERREMLAASVLTASTFLFPHSAFGAPVQPPPDVSSCVAPTSSGNQLPFLTELDYCMGIGGQNITATPFVFPAERKVRKAAHKMSASEVADYNEAYKRMRALSDEDPRSLRRQAAIHAAFCNFVYKGTQGESTFLNMHGSDLFLPWHRFYIYFHERILGELIGKKTLAIPYWNWDDQVEGGNTMPTIFENEKLYPDLRNVKRNQEHLPPVIVDLGWPRADGNTPTNLIAENTAIMYNAVVRSNTPALFMGGSFLTEPGTGSLETVHNGTHRWTGDPTFERAGEDMGFLYSAGRDPIFYSHHSNVDRLWGVWESLPGTVNTDAVYNDSSFRESSFVFYDEKSRLVKVSVADCLTASSKLNISYQPATKGDANWINYKPQASRRNLQTSKDQKRKSGKALRGPQILTDTICALVTPPPSADQNVSKQPILVLENVKLFLSNPVSFAIFIDFPDADSTTGLDCAEFVGLYTNIPHVGMEDMMEGPSKLRLKFPLRDCVQTLNLDSNAPFIVNVVSRSNPDPIKYPVSIGGFRIIYE